MKKIAPGIVVTLFAVGFALAGEESPHEQTILKMLKSVDTISDELKKIVDEDTATAAKAELRKAADGWIDARAKAAKLQPPEKAEKVRLEKIYKPKIEESMRKMFTQTRRVELIPGGKEALKEIAGVLKKDRK